MKYPKLPPMPPQSDRLTDEEADALLEGLMSAGVTTAALAPARAISIARFQTRAARSTSRVPIGTATIGSAAGVGLGATDGPTAPNSPSSKKLGTVGDPTSIELARRAPAIGLARRSSEAPAGALDDDDAATGDAASGTR